MSLSTLSYAQGPPDWNTQGNNIISTEWFGADLTSTVPLHIRHDRYLDIIFSHDVDERMRIAGYGNVEIGGVSSTPLAKLAVQLYQSNAATAPDFESTAIYANNSFPGNEQFPVNRGVRAMARGFSPEIETENYGGTFWATSGNRNFGVMGVAAYFENGVPEGNDLAGEQGFGVVGLARDHEWANIAIEGRAEAHQLAPGAWTVGILAAAGPAAATNAYSGWFDGDIMYNGLVLTPSDQALKENVEDVEGAMDIVNQLQPKTFNYLTEEYEFMGLPDGQQYGVIAQEMAEVLPNLTRDASRPAMLDSVGNEVTPGIDFKAVSYTGLIPILVAGMKEQQSIIDAQNDALANVMDQLDDLQQQINNCCSGDSGFKNYNPDDIEEQPMQKSSPNGNVLDQNTPNPFRSQTTISYTLEQGGKVVLNVYDKNGKVVAQLEEAEQPADNYRYEWDASGLPAGLYHYALYVDGELLVKKAIKLKE